MSSSLRRASAALLSALILTTSCTSDPEPDPRPSARPTPSPRAGQGGPLLFGMIGAPATLDPYGRLASDLTYALARPVYPSLLRFLPNGTPQLHLAQAIDKRRGTAIVRLVAARWSDGRAITAHDVVASARRASPPSGFAGLDVAAVDRRTVRFEGEVGDWERRLATLTFVLQGGRAGGAYGGPYSIRRYVKGFEVALRRNSNYWGARAKSPRINVRFVQDLDLLLLLLERGRLDAAAPPATVNLDERLAEYGLDFDRKIGWEALWLDFRSSRLGPLDHGALLSGIAWDKLATAFVRDEGKQVLSFGRPQSSTVIVNETLIGPTGDELLSLIMRAAWFQLKDEGHAIELLRVEPEVLYGRWADDGPAGVAFRRLSGAPGTTDPLAAGADAYKVFELASFVTWRDGVEGLSANPTFDGPLWNAEEIEAG